MKTSFVRHRVGPFVTSVAQPLTGGEQISSDSRRHRKRLPPRRLDADGNPVRTTPVTRSWLHLWALRRLAWWVAVLFIAGSACFALASAALNWPQYFFKEFTAGSVINGTFFIGSLFFTSAAWLQLLEAINGDVDELGEMSGEHQRSWRWFAWKPHNAGYMASLIQLAGTILFNFNTGDAMLAGLGRLEEDILIWIPNMTGSICFLVASYLALIENSHGWWSFEPRKVAWWVVVINLLGSIAFQISALYGYFPAQPEPGWAWDSNLWTFIGAVCFFVASYLMIPELFDADAKTPGKAVRLAVDGAVNP